MEIRLQTGNSFSVPVTVADHFLKLATHDQLKILLYALCHAEKPLAAEEIMRACSVTQSAVEEALVFWQNVNVLTNSAPAEPVTVHVQTATAPVQQVQEVLPEKKAAKSTVSSSSSSFRLMPIDIEQRTKNDPVTAEIMLCAEQCAGRPLNFTEVKSIIWMHEYLGLSADVLLLLLSYCAENKLFQVRTMEKIAVLWQEKGILTKEQAEAYLQKRDERTKTDAQTYLKSVMQIFGMTQMPIESQQDVFMAWYSLKMPIHMVQIAYEIMRQQTRIDASSKSQINYTDSIIQRWASEGVFTPEAVEKAEQAFRASAQKSTAKSPQKRRAPQPQKPSAQTAQSSINLADAEKLINKKL